MVRSLFLRRLPLAVSIVVLLLVSLSFGAPTHVVFAKTHAPAKTCAQNDLNCAHLYVVANVNAPAETEGAFGVFQQYHPTVASTDEESLVQVAITDGTHTVEAGWVSTPGSKSSVIFVNVRDNVNLPTGGTSCYVQKVNGSWTCGFTSFSAFNTTGYYPGHSVPSDGTPALIYLLNTGTDIYIQYGADWLGKITNQYWLSGSFGSVTIGEWQGEVAVNNNFTTHTQMGNGTCGSDTGSASISDMEWFVGQVGSGTFQPVNAPLSSLTQTAPFLYNYGNFTGNSFTYGGPGVHFPPC